MEALISASSPSNLMLVLSPCEATVRSNACMSAAAKSAGDKILDFRGTLTKLSRQQLSSLKNYVWIGKAAPPCGWIPLSNFQGHCHMRTVTCDQRAASRVSTAERKSW